jgi:hypothetical protein
MLLASFGTGHSNREWGDYVAIETGSGWGHVTRRKGEGWQLNERWKSHSKSIRAVPQHQNKPSIPQFLEYVRIPQERINKPMRYELLTAIRIQNVVLWVVIPCFSINETCYLH